MRGSYEKTGVKGYYQKYGPSYRNPHDPAVAELLRRSAKAWKLRPGRFLDLACGSGEVTLALAKLGFAEIDGIDPYTAEAYRARTGRDAETLTFEQIAAGALSGRIYDTIVCSFALHLLEPSRLPGLLARLAEIAYTLIVLTPTKRPRIEPETGWIEVDEVLHDRVRARLYARRTLT
jgi:2-polyprenyl-3-methyl-5-hydroxy-6-metoxy-1,4-benzoquinol methylase